jgi:hypothetical protein
MEAKKKLMVCALAVLLVGWGLLSGVRAQDADEESDIILPGSLGNLPFATDVYHVLCGAGTSRLNADVRDLGGVDGIRLSVCVNDSGGNPAHCTIAPDGSFSSSVPVVGGVGAYYVTISRSPFSAFEQYQTNIQCRNAAGGLTVTTPVLVQNE